MKQIYGCRNVFIAFSPISNIWRVLSNFPKTPSTLPDTLPWKWRNDSKSFCQRDSIVLKPLQKLILNLRSFSSQFLGLKFFKVGWTFLCVFFAETSFCQTETSKLWLSWTFVSVFSWLKTFSLGENYLLGCRSSMRYEISSWISILTFLRWRVSYTNCPTKHLFVDSLPWDNLCGKLVLAEEPYEVDVTIDKIAQNFCIQVSNYCQDFLLVKWFYFNLKLLRNTKNNNIRVIFDHFDPKYRLLRANLSCPVF